MAFTYFDGVYHVRRRSEKKRGPLDDLVDSPERTWLGWDDEERILYMVPTDSSLRSDHITGSNRSMGILVDRIVHILETAATTCGVERRARVGGQ